MRVAEVRYVKKGCCESSMGEEVTKSFKEGAENDQKWSISSSSSPFHSLTTCMRVNVGGEGSRGHV